MGTTTSRPILHAIESFLLQIAQFVDVGVRLVERILSSLFSLCLPSTIFSDYQLNHGREVPICDNSGVCYVPATSRLQQHAQFKQRYEERLKRRKLRAEWAAAGLDVIEMERQEQARKKRQQQKAALHQIAEKCHAEQMLGPVAKAPRLRPAEERETAAERSKGKLWVMGNVTPRGHTLLPKRQDKPEIRMPEVLHRRGAALESVRETSIHESPSHNYAVHGHGSRIASGVSEHADVSYCIVATSRDRSEASPGADSKAGFRADQRRRTVTSQGIMPSQAQVLASTSSASRLDAEMRQISSKEGKAAPSLSPSPKLMQPVARRHHRSLDFVASNEQLSFKHHDKKDPIDLRSDSPRFFNRARASLDMVTTAAATRPSSPSSPALPPFSSASSDAGSIASRRSIFGLTSPSASISRSSTPPCVADLAEAACKPRWQANARERKLWKGAVNDLTLHKLQQTSRRRVSLEPKPVVDKAEKMERRSFQKPSHCRINT